MSKMMVISEKFIESLKEKEYLSTDEAIKILGNGVMEKNELFSSLYVNVLRLIGDSGAVKVLISRDIPNERKAAIEKYIVEMHIKDESNFPNAAAYVASNGSYARKMDIVWEIRNGRCEDLMLEIAMGASENVAHSLLEAIDRRLVGLEYYAYEGEIKREILRLKNFAFAVSKWDNLSDEIRKMAGMLAI